MTSRRTTTFDTASALKRLGWTRNPGHALADFQRGWNLGPALKVDGIAGPKTNDALLISLARLNHHQPTASEHFSYTEFACGCGGQLPSCQVIRVHRELLAGLEVYRQQLGASVHIASGYRCPSHNKAVGGATSSQHLYGAAADLDYHLTDKAVALLKRFSGIGRKATTHLVRHVDVRHVSGNNTTGASPARPTVWDYA